MPSSTVEDYLKSIYLEQVDSGGKRVPPGRISNALNVSPGTVTAMLKTLSEAGLVRYEPYSGVVLTLEGRRLAMHVLRRHRVVELFLVKMLGMSWSEVHKDAEILEHAVSDRLIERMDELLNRPEVDPHGDPIPSASGTLVERNHPDLLSCPAGVRLRLARVLDQRSEFLRLLESRGLTPGSELRVVARNEAADTVQLDLPGREPFNLGYRAASKILVDTAPVEMARESRPAPASKAGSPGAAHRHDATGEEGA